MRRKRNVLGESTSKRISNRSLKSKRIGHGEVYSGDLANEALGALGARAIESLCPTRRPPQLHRTRRI